MALNDLITNLVGVGDRIAKSVEVPILHEAWVSNNGAFAAPLFATGVTRYGLCDDRVQKVTLSTGDVITVQAIITFMQPIADNGATGRREPVDPRDRFTLPSGYTGPIKNIDGGLDNPTTLRPYLIQVYLG